ncbi:hypothetical protein L210DRAFT_945137 [Boletus edulis BED1]|uniref:Uncharacterized protein n=1 Tax=Boletus edulis BED1 TaxID=1328754 RepID=A0AAD4C5B4_BOLED|nr:hypothetical protein L210DRAFT_945137 [Boletus edulis BED1]
MPHLPGFPGTIYDIYQRRAVEWYLIWEDQVMGISFGVILLTVNNIRVLVSGLISRSNGSRTEKCEIYLPPPWWILPPPTGTLAFKRSTKEATDPGLGTPYELGEVMRFRSCLTCLRRSPYPCAVTSYKKTTGISKKHASGDVLPSRWNNGKCTISWRRTF